MNSIKKKDIITCGFALFAIFFGAGNLIFPPYLGILAGNRWYEPMAGFFLTDPVLAITCTLIVFKLGGNADDLWKRVGSKNFGKIFGVALILMIGPLFPIPRTGAATHELFTQTLFGENIPYIVTSAIFFGITLWLAINPSKVMDYVGNILTPVLLIILAVIAFKSFTSPPGQMVITNATGLFSYGFKEGYQTMDGLLAAMVAGVINADLIRRGYNDDKIKMKASIGIGLVAFVCLVLVYGSLSYAGATAGEYFTADMPRTDLLMGVTSLLMGDMGKVALGIATALACLTTSTGLVCVCGNYMETMSDNKLKYKVVVIAVTALSFLISLIGVEGIITIAAPALTAMYPVIIILTFLSVFDKKIKYNWTYTGAVVGTLSASVTEGLGLFGEIAGVNILASLNGLVQMLPLSDLSLGWVIPSIIGSVIFTLISKITKKGEYVTQN